MAASVCTVECPSPNEKVRVIRETDIKSAPPADSGLDAVRPEDQARAAEAASIAEFAHDLCSPLSALAMIAHSLKDASASEDQNENIQTIIHISEHMLGIVRDVLECARMDARRGVPRIEPCDLEALVRKVTEFGGACAQAKNLEFVLRRKPACPRFIRTDASMLQRILINILDNAAKYTAKGSITLSVKSADCLDPEWVWIIFEICDTGIGIARAEQDRIFDRFARGSGAADVNGSGLGLTIAAQLVHSLGGKIRLASKPGMGSTFRIELPVGRVQESQETLPWAAHAVPLH